MDSLVYGVVVGGVFHSGRMARKLLRCIPNGIYSMDMGVDEFEKSISPADISEATKFFRKASRTDVVRGVSFRDGMVPDNPVASPVVPVKVIDPTYDEFEEVEVLLVRSMGYYFLRTVDTDKAYTLMDIKERLASKNKNLDGIKGVTPAMRIVYSLHLIEIYNKEQAEPENAIRKMMEETGAKVTKVLKMNRGFRVSWEFDRHKLVTILDKEYKVVNAGYCVNGSDRVLSVRSVVNVLKDGLNDGEGIHTTTSNDDDFDDDFDDE
jgi:hypothetical protein